MQKSKFIFIVALWCAAILPARACDLCGCYTPQVEALPEFGSEHAGRLGLYGAVAEQFTYFGTLQFEGREVGNPTDQSEASSITQLVAGYSLSKRFALQINLPLIYRSFERPEGFAIDRGTESGLGDVSLLLKTVVLHLAPPHSDFSLSALVISGLKFPTGDSSRIKEEFQEIEIPGAPESGIHGHDLTLGTGSFDGILGGQISARYKHWFVQADTQFALRGDGNHQYHFANDLSWSGGPGYYFVRKRALIAGVQCVCSGEHKDVDRFRGQRAEDTGITSVFLGPRILASWRRWSGELGADLPVLIDNTALQAVPDYRLRGSIAISF